MKKDKKSAHPTAATAERARLDAEAWQATASATKDTTIAPSRQGFLVSGLLSHGAENGVTLCHLEKLTGLSGREVRRQIERERRRGIPILSDNMSGYFLPSSEDEKARCVRSMKGRAREILRTARAIEGAAGLGE